MKVLFILFLLISFTASSQELTEVRKLYSVANTSRDAAQKFSKLIQPYSGTNQTLLAYKAAAMMLMSKHELDVIQKKKKFTQGAHLLESVVEKDKLNSEIRMIRLSIQENVPKIVKYSMNIEEDKSFLLKNYYQQNTSLKLVIKQFIKQSKSFSEEEKNSFI